MKKFAVLSLSGGMDSSTLMLKLINEGYKVVALSFNYNQKHKIELEKSIELVQYLNVHLSSKGEELIRHKVVNIDLLGFLKSNLISGGESVPEGHYAEENMKQTVVPNRNKIFSSIIQSVALSIQNEYPESKVVIAMGIHSGDHDIYPDCRQEFRDLDYKAFLSGNWGAEKIEYYTPYLEIDKHRILEDGLVSCSELCIDFKEVYSRTMTSYKPIYDYERDTWYSDYKSGSSIERIEAFMKLGVQDPVIYAHELEDGEPEVVSWEEVCEYATVVLKQKG